MIRTNVDSLWLLALVSKCNSSLTLFNAIIIACMLPLPWLIFNLIFWAHSGGPAWGKYRWTKQRAGPITIQGPRGFPITGSMNLVSGLAHHKLAAEARAHGAQRLMAFSIGETRAVLTCDPDVAREILNGSNFADRPPQESAYGLMFNRSIGFAPYGVYWAALRKVAAAHLFSPKQMKASEHRRLEIAKSAAEEVRELSFLCSGGHVRVRDVLKRASMENMMWSVFGRRYDAAGGSAAAEEELKELVEEGYDLLGKLNWSDHLSFLGDLDVQRIRLRCSGIVPRVNRFVGRIIAEHRAAAEKERREGDFVDVLLSLDSSLSDSDMIAVLWEMIFRGTDTVAILIEWILARLVMHPEVQSKVHDELDRVVGESRAVTDSDLPELVYLTAVVKEVLRLHPPGPLLSWSRLSIRDSVVDGHPLPAGTTAMVNMWAIMRDPNLWADPLRFDPERFVGRRHSDAAADDGISVMGADLRIAPFGSGRRSCPGKALGLTTVVLWVATLLREFRFTSARGVDLSEVLRLSCEMANPLMVRVGPRRPVSGSCV